MSLHRLHCFSLLPEGIETASGVSLTLASDYTVDGVAVPERCFEFCSLTDVRRRATDSPDPDATIRPDENWSMFLTCVQLSQSLCESGNFYQTDAVGDRRHCRFDEECFVDDSFVCNASWPICQVAESSTASAEASTTTESTHENSTETSVSEASHLPTGPPTDGPQTASRTVASEMAKAVEAAAHECLASGSTDQDTWKGANQSALVRILKRSVAQTPLMIASPAERALKKALDVALLMGFSEDQLKQAFTRAGDDGNPLFCAKVSACDGCSLQQCATGDFYVENALCEMSEDEDTWPGTRFSCNVSCAHEQVEADEEKLAPDVFCRSLCAKKAVVHCSALLDEDCKSDRFYTETRQGFVLCAWDEDERNCGIGRQVQPFAPRTPMHAWATSPPPRCAWPTAAAPRRIARRRAPMHEHCDGKCRPYRPNIVMILANSMGFNDFFDSTDLTASAWPYVTSILPESIRLNSSYAEVASAPSRASFLTGRWQQHLLPAETPSLSVEQAFGSKGWSPLGVSHHRQLGSTAGAFSQGAERTVAQKLNAAGYKSYAIGKWQAGGVSWNMTPSGRGFARFFGSYDDASDYVNHCDVNGHYDLHYEETEPFEANSTWQFTRPYHYYPSGPEMVGKHANTIFQEKAQQFIHEHQARYGIDGTPMFLYFAPMSFQEPLQAPKWTAENCTVAGGFSSAPNANRQTLCRMAIALDKTIEQIADSLAGASREWVMIIASDSGGSAARKGSGGSNWPLRGSKGEVWEGGMRTWGWDKGHTYSGLVHLVDWHTMILHLAHASGLRPAMPEDPDGLQFWEELLTNTPSPRREFISNVTGFAALRSGDYKLVKAPDGGKSPWTGENQGFRHSPDEGRKDQGE
eukprot:g23577.t1